MNLESTHIAIVGMGCRFPQAETPQAFWEFLHEGRDGITEVPKDRWDIDAFYDPNAGTPGKMNTRWGSFIEQVDGFDPSFFGISPREAKYMDPQQRLLLEVAWEALENAGIAPERLAGSQTGVFVGFTNIDYHTLIYRDVSRIEAYSGTGTHPCIIPGRLSYVLNLRGPSIAVDTACSSSLVAIHFACQSLKTGESDVCFAGGVNLILSPEMTITFSHARMMAADGRCKTFDAAADGYVRGEGCGVVILKRLEDALRDGDNIQAIIRGSAINQDGLSNGLTAPNGPSQQAVIRQALANAGVKPAQISYVEAHGTGTPLGDPVEVNSLKTVLMEGRKPNQPCWIGSVKSNLGHLEAAAGIVGIIKVVLSLQHRQIPPHLHFKQLNPFIRIKNTPIQIPTELQQWPAEGQPRLAGVSAFSFSGTNAHVILEEAPVEVKSQNSPERSFHLLTLSAKTEPDLQALVSRYQRHLQANPNQVLADICFSANTGRDHFVHRLAVVVSSIEQLIEQLAALTSGKDSTRLLSNQPGKKLSKIAFLFTGQGSQYINMGRQLYDTQPIFRQTIEQCNEILRPLLEHSLLDVLYPDQAGEEVASKLAQTALTQPALFALEYALYQLWKSWGIEPDAVMGHSVGEYVAATVAGVFSLEDGLKLIAHRGRLMQQLLSGGEMVSVMATESLVTEAVAPFHHTVSIAAINGPESVVISGDSQDIGAICHKLEAQVIKTKPLLVSHAFHSPLMAPMLREFEAVANEVTYKQPRITLVSNVTGKIADEQVTKAQYWVNHVRQPVQFATSIETLHQLGYGVFLEIGPKPILLGMGRQCLPDSEGLWLPSLRPGVDEWQQLLESLAQLYVRGVSVNWSGFDREYPRTKVALPTYAFQRQRYWFENTLPQHQSFSKQQQNSTKLHPLIDKKVQSPLYKEILFESDFSTETLPFLVDHLVYNKVVVPGACHLSLLLGAANLTFATGACLLENIVFPQALVIPQEGVRKVQLVLSPFESGTSFQLISFDPTNSVDNSAPDGSTQVNQWVVHATGKISNRVNTTLETISIQEIQARCPQQIAGVEIYQSWQKRQIQLGPSFQWLDTIWHGVGEALAQMKWPALVDEINEYQLYPGLLDSCFQLSITFLPTEDTFVPFAIESFRFYQRPQTQQLWCHALRRHSENFNADKLIADIKLFDASGELIAEILGVEAKKSSRELLLHSLHQDVVADWLYEIDWQAVDKSQWAATPQGSWLILTDPQGLGQQLAEQLQQQKANCILVSAGVSYEEIDQQNYQIDPSQPQHWQKLLTAVSQHQITSIIHLWSQQQPSKPENSLPAIEQEQNLSCGSVLHLIQGLVQANLETPPRLWLVTRGTQALSTAPVPVQLNGSSLWGLGRVIALEHPELQCVRLDLDPVAKDSDLSVLWSEICSPDAEDQVAYRQGLRYVARLARRKALLAVPSVNPDSSYWITGGLGALGLEVAGWLVEQGARHLVLTGRHGPSPTAQERIAALEQSGVKVLVVEADVSQADEVVGVVEKIESLMPVLRGIVHAAGVLDDGVLQQQSLERFRRVMAPKVAGAWNLHTFTQHLPLEFFVCFSSMSSLIGSTGQGNYAAANAFMDTLANYRRAMGLPGLSINWGPWANVGMAANLDSRDFHRMQAMGISAIAPQRALAVLEQLLNQSAAQVAVLSINWSQLLSKSALASPFFANLADSLAKKVEQSEFRARLESAKIGDRRKLLINYITSQVAQVLGQKLSQTPDLQQGFFELGMDSLMAVELRNRLQNSLGYSLPSSLIFDYPTITKLTDYLAENVISLEFDDKLLIAVQQENTKTERLNQLEALSQDEIADLLAQKLLSI